MSLISRLDRLHIEIRENSWFVYFSIFCRLALAAGFIPSGMQKISGERFTVLPPNHPMGHYLDALFQTGYYYTTIGVFQVAAAILLLIPRTATLGAVIYFPIILNICILSLAVGFDGSLFTSPLMVLACLFLLFWDYHKFKFILPFKHPSGCYIIPKKKGLNKKFPKFFFLGVFLTCILIVSGMSRMYTLLPRNTLSECRKQCFDSDFQADCFVFCECIHKQGLPFNKCLTAYKEKLQ